MVVRTPPGHANGVGRAIEDHRMLAALAIQAVGTLALFLVALAHGYTPAEHEEGWALFRRASGEVVLLMDADGQMDPRYVPEILGGVAAGFDMVVGARTRDTQGDTLARRLGNRALDGLGAYLVESEVRDLTSGYRAMRREVIMEFIHLLPNRYSYPTTSTLALLKGGYSVGYVTIEGQRRQGGQSGQKLLKNGVKFGLIIMRIVSQMKSSAKWSFRMRG